MKEFPVEFETTFEGQVIPKQLGRLYLGGHVCRLCMYPDGHFRLYAPRAAINDGSITLMPEITEEPILFGFGFAETKGD